MKPLKAKQLTARLLALADVRINGDRPWDIHVHNDRLYERVMAGGSLALGESYMDGWWDSPALDRFFTRVLAARLDRRLRRSAKMMLATARCRLHALPNRARAFEIGRRHYDIGNELFAAMLDREMNYSCAYWDSATDLDGAQQAKMDLICRKLDLAPGMTVLDIGCGWGGLAGHAARHYGVKVIGITVSARQAELAGERCKDCGVDIKLKDYRSMRQRFDRVVSVGMFEHVGWRHYATFMKVVQRCLKPNGLFLLHTIGGNRSVHSTDPWIEKYIFPNSMLPSAQQISAAAEGRFILEDWHSLGQHYDTTLMAWYRNFCHHWHRIKHLYDTRFYRMWTYYLLSSAASFRARRNQLWQIVFSPYGRTDPYQRIRA